MPKFNPKQKTRSQKPSSPSPSTPEKKSGTYKRGSPKLTKFYGLLIIAAVATGMVFLLMNYQNLPPPIAQWDHIQLRLKIWIWPPNGEWNESMPTAYDDTQWYNFTTIYEPSTETNNASIYYYGLPTGIYERVRTAGTGVESAPFKIDNCVDTNPKDGNDDKTGSPALGWGFVINSLDPFKGFFNKTIVVSFEILEHIPHT